MTFDGRDLLAMEPHERAAAGMFLGFQYPVEIPGVSYLQFLRESLNSQRRARGEAELSGAEFIRLAKDKAALLGMDAEMLKRPVNVGFSGGEKKRAEMVQMGIMDPKLAILDETDSGLDIDALKAVGAGINSIMRAPDKVGAADHPLPAPARLCDAGPGACAVARQDRAFGRARTGARARARRLCGGGGVTALPTRKLEAYRYADIDALASMFGTALAQPRAGRNCCAAKAAANLAAERRRRRQSAASK